MFRPFEKAVTAPPDKILGLKEEINKDPRPNKIDLTIGVYRSDDGVTHFLDILEEARKAEFQSVRPSGDAMSALVEYVPITGVPSFTSLVQELIFGKDAPAVCEKRIVTSQSLGGTGALRIGADFLKRHYPESRVFISDPTWPNHRLLFQRVGFEVSSYPYYDIQKKSVRFEEMYASLEKAPLQSIILLQAACHNPTGFDLQASQWDQIADLCVRREFIPFFDFAYQGFDAGIEEDAKVIRSFLAKGLCFLVAGSFSKNFSLYNSRLGSLSLVTGSADEALRVSSQLKTDIRANYSSPAREPAQVVARVLGDSNLRRKWEDEVSEMRKRIALMRSSLLQCLEKNGHGDRFSHLRDQKGLFFFSGLSPEQMLKLKHEFGIYGVDDGRICIAAITSKTVERIAEAIAAV